MKNFHTYLPQNSITFPNSTFDKSLVFLKLTTIELYKF
ncbi:hypothetical protein LEP1GSC073_2004 [Leptospira noguchii str. Cascata]|nr:hypothetical protein LEP1GSC072_1848 [Leptospira noguchii str. Bonito]EMS85201.1 hypothetical protein LEP1GSC073_2004 [Leptospira noguchii str. Cascata]